LQSRGVSLEQLVQSEESEPSKSWSENSGAGPRIPLAAVIRRLGELACTSVLVEGGTAINTAVLNEVIADKLTIFYAPVFLGADAVPMLASSIARSVERGTIPQRFSLRKFGEDFAFDAYLRDPWAGVS
jgi:diaminohydroxyphosphoribosylaminopyrimidine deaminase/5-amino-6-(5-phosphoribosylamino)uracil reductase